MKQDILEMSGADILAELQRVSDAGDYGFVGLQWVGKGDELGYPWPDVDVKVQFEPEPNGVMFPEKLMPDTLTKVTLTKGFFPGASASDIATILADAVALLGEPSVVTVE